MKFLVVIVVYILSLNSHVFAQQPATGTPVGAFAPSVGNTTRAWLRGGNTATGSGLNDNIFGTAFNSPIYTITNGSHRMRVNGNLTTTVNLVTGHNVGGFVGIAPGGYFAANTPAAMLHLYGPNNTTFGIGGGWRRWMQTGMLVNENSDAIYVGMMPQPGLNRSDAVVAWNDDGGGGQDKLRFIFTGANLNGNGTGTSPIDPRSLNGYEFMRMSSSPSQTNSSGQASGNLGIGPVFTDVLPPQNRLHMNAEEDLAVFMQISNGSGTGQGPLDGLIAGYPATSVNNREAMINQRENDRLSMYTNNGERMRITHLGALNAGTAFNPGGLPVNRTRIGISHDPGSPVTRPLSLLHLGYNTGAFPGGTTDGWRPWMDIGMFISNGTDNGYLGLKHETNGLSGDREDMVLNWGDNQSAGSLATGPDNLRFIFTSTTTGVTGTPPATGPDGLEAMRMTPTLTTGIFTGIGGDPTAGATGNQYGPAGTSINPTATLEVNSWGTTNAVGGSSGLRFTNLNTTSPVVSPNPGPGVLSVDADGDVIYVAGGGTGIGNYCGVSPSNPLTADYEIPMNANNYYFTDPAGPLNDGENFVKIGDNCGAVVRAKLEINRNLTVNSQSRVIGAFCINSDLALSNPLSGSAYGFAGNARGNNRLNSGVFGTSSGASQNCGGLFEAITAFSSGSANNNNYGIMAYAANAQNNYAVYATVAGSGAPGPGTPSGPNYAGFFNGDVYISGTYGPSDASLKDSIQSISNALEIIQQLNPKTFEFRHTSFPSMNLPKGLQYGLIAQEVETVLPALVTNNIQPAVYDTLGAVVTPEVSFKGLEYQQLIPILLKGMKEQQSKIDSLDQVNNTQDSINTALQNQLTAISEMITSCCNTNHSMLQNNPGSVIGLEVELKDGQSIVLEQNVPNPFAEQTTISYFLPENTSKAQILFYNSQGKLIQSTELIQKGRGQLNVFASDLTNGIYTYTLVVDGKIIGTKKMVKQ
ncbi:MAG TPA: tail fiber domain-containing protein [Bacteroidia bacterium]|jgi:hypothetical protein